MFLFAKQAADLALLFEPNDFIHFTMEIFIRKAFVLGLKAKENVDRLTTLLCLGRSYPGAKDANLTQQFKHSAVCIMQISYLMGKDTFERG